MSENMKKDMPESKINSQEKYNRRLKEISLLDLFSYLTSEAQDEIIMNIITMLDNGKIKNCIGKQMA